MKKNSPFFKPPFIIGCICGAIIIIGVFIWLTKRASIAFEEKLCQDVCEINNKLPKKIDEFTILDSVAFIKRKPSEVAYFYRLLGKLDNPDMWNESRIQSYRSNTLESVAKSETTRPMRERGVLFSYHFYSDSIPQRLLFEFVLGSDDYSKKE